jgi:MoxR-like ATPase
MAKNLAPKQLTPKKHARDAGPPPQPASLHTTRGLIARLGLVGLDALEPVVIASLATAAPLLLIGAHGSAKSLLLERIALALGLRWRHYNAALVNYDDLVGYPLPDERGQLRFVETPASVWGAQAVFVDEISRARLDMQNRLFPIVHERRVQGIELSELRHRWAAMNPPAADDGEDAPYAGSHPLDTALADRFAFHVPMPDWRHFGADEQEAVIRAHAAGLDADAPAAWSAALQRTGELLPRVERAWAAALARYVRHLAALLDEAGFTMSARRAGMVARNVAAVHAARLASDAGATLEDSAWIATLHSMPFAASGRHLDGSRLLAAHRQAWQTAAVRPDDPMGRILGERDPVERVRIALEAELPDGELATVVTDALHTLPEGARHALARWLFESGTVERLPVVAADAVAETYRDVACVREVAEFVRPCTARHGIWQAIRAHVARDAGAGAERRANLLAALFGRKQLQTAADVGTVLERYAATCARLEVAC